MTDEDRLVVERMRARVQQCRRLAKAILDRSAAAVLEKMAQEIEADIKRQESDSPDPTSTSRLHRKAEVRALRFVD